MKQLRCVPFAATVAAVLGMTCGMADAGLLTNGGFEAGDLSGWNNNADGTNITATVGAPTVGAQEGSFALELNSASGDNVPEVSQGIFGIGPNFFPASEGQEYSLSGYMLTESVLPGGATFGLLKIVFEDAAGNDLVPASASEGVINAAFPGIESLPFLDAASPANEWIYTSARGVAPAGTATVAFLVLDVDFGNGPNHPMWFDNVVAERIPEPSTLALLSLVGLSAVVSPRRKK